MSERADERLELDRRLRSWLDDGPDLAPRDLADDVMAPIATMHRRPRWGRFVPAAAPQAAMSVLMAAAVIAVAAVLGFLAVTRALPDVGASPGPASDYQTNDFGVSRAGQVGRAGTYRSWQFRPQVRFDVPAGWGIGGLEAGFVGTSEGPTVLPLTNGLGSIVVTRPSSVDAPGPDTAQAPPPTDVLAWLLTNPDLDLGSPVSVRIGGRDATVLEGTLAADAGLDPETGALRVTDQILLRPRHRFRLAVVPDAGGSLVVATIAPADRFDDFRPTADRIIESVGFVTP